MVLYIGVGLCLTPMLLPLVTVSLQVTVTSFVSKVNSNSNLISTIYHKLGNFHYMKFLCWKFFVGSTSFENILTQIFYICNSIIGFHMAHAHKERQARAIYAYSCFVYCHFNVLLLFAEVSHTLLKFNVQYNVLWNTLAMHTSLQLSLNLTQLLSALTPPASSCSQCQWMFLEGIPSKTSCPIK